MLHDKTNIANVGLGDFWETRLRVAELYGRQLR